MLQFVDCGCPALRVARDRSIDKFHVIIFGHPAPFFLPIVKGNQVK